MAIKHQSDVRKVPEQNSIPADLFLQAIALHRAGKLDDAEPLYHTLLAANPKHVPALTLLGTIYAQRGNYAEGIGLMGTAIAIKPDHAEAYFNRALSLQRLGRYQDALKDYEKATIIDPTYREAQWHKGLIQLTLGQYEEGWKQFEWRWKNKPEDARHFPQPVWLGNDSLENKTILIYAEQGLGDTIQFCRYIPMVEALGAKVIFEVDVSLVKLIITLEGSYHLMAAGSPLPEFDLHCPLMSLPLAFRTSISTIPADIPYLFVDSHKQKLWQSKLSTKTKPRIGLAWSGDKRHQNDHNRSIALRFLNPILHNNFEFHSLQNEYKPDDAAFLAHQSPIISHAEDLKDFSDTAALISEMDLIISVDTSVVHLAGALGKPVWILLPFVPDFRWLTEKKDSPWYPTARLFRQPRERDWDSAIAEVKVKLKAFHSRNPYDYA